MCKRFVGKGVKEYICSHRRAGHRKDGVKERRNQISRCIMGDTKVRRREYWEKGYGLGW